MSKEKIKVGNYVVLHKREADRLVEFAGYDKPMRISDVKDDDQKFASCKEMEFAKLTKQMLETFKKKNADYGDSTTQTFKEFGLTSYAIRLNDKLNRVKSFCKKGGLEVKDESCIDALMDMASYCLLAVIDIKNKENGKDNKE